MRRILVFVLAAVSVLACHGADGQTTGQRLFVDCSQHVAGDGSLAHPWNSLAAAEAHTFTAGDVIALARGTVCPGTFAPQGSGTSERPIRLTAYGHGKRPRIVATGKDRQAFLLFNQEYWQVDSLDFSGGSKYGVFVSGDKGAMHHIYLKNLLVHDVQGGELKSKDNGLVVVDPSSRFAFFDDVVLDGVVAAHTNQWAGILAGGQNYPYAPDAPLNKNITVRNSSVQDVYGDGIVLFRDSDGVIESSTAWETGMEPTETTGTPNAIWTWTCTDCVVRDNEAFLTDSPGVDGGAYDIDWDNTRNTVERNYAHDTQGYCFAVFAAGYVTRESVVRDNLCINNGLSPRLAALQGAAYLHTWNGGVLAGLRIEHNTFIWNPPVSSAAAIVDDASIKGAPVTFSGNLIESASSAFYRTNAEFAAAGNNYVRIGDGEARFTLGDKRDVDLGALQGAGIEKGTALKHARRTEKSANSLRIEAMIDFALDTDGLLASGPRAQLMVLKSLAAQYGPATLDVRVHLGGVPVDAAEQVAEANALLDLDAGGIRFDHEGKQANVIRLLTADGQLLAEWNGYQNAATLGGAVRARIGAPHFAEMFQETQAEGKQ